MHSENVRQRLLDVGEKVIHEQGFNGTGIQQITQLADVPKGSFYNHFSSKEYFVTEVVTHHWSSHTFQSALETLQDTQLGDARERLRQYFAHRAALHETQAFRSGCLLGNLASEMADQSEMIRVRLCDTTDRWSAALSACIRQGQESGQLARTIEPDSVGSCLLDAWQGAVARAKLTRNRTPFDQFLKLIFEPLLP